MDPSDRRRSRVPAPVVRRSATRLVVRQGAWNCGYPAELSRIRADCRIEFDEVLKGWLYLEYYALQFTRLRGRLLSGAQDHQGV
jgi:hypothetical protein